VCECVCVCICGCVNEMFYKKNINKLTYLFPQAIDLFMSTCTAFVFASMMEYAIINWILGDMDSKKLESSYKKHVTDKIIDRLTSPETTIIKKQANGGDLLQEPEIKELLDKEPEIEEPEENEENEENEELLSNNDNEKTKSPSGSKGSETGSGTHVSRSRLRCNSKVTWENGLVSAEEEAEEDILDETTAYQLAL
ncbi:unnamed protein product, partial [Meganyctiphanes norvegica]